MPGVSLGVNENGLRHCGQNPSVRPGWPCRERPTAAPHEGQTRLSSGTCGSTISAVAASTAGCGGTVVRPAPRRAARSRTEDVPVRRVTLVAPAVRAEPIGADASRDDARDTVDGLLSKPALLTPATAGGAAPAGDPQMSQYPSRIVPVQPGWVQVVVVIVFPRGAR